jgi:hypothetical protein
MSGLPGGGPSDQTPNWVVSSWPPETQTILTWQWDERLLPYWSTLADHATANGVTKLAVELHGNQLVYNPTDGISLQPSRFVYAHSAVDSKSLPKLEVKLRLMVGGGSTQPDERRGQRLEAGDAIWGTHREDHQIDAGCGVVGCRRRHR